MKVRSSSIAVRNDGSAPGKGMKVGDEVWLPPGEKAALKYYGVCLNGENTTDSSRTVEHSKSVGQCEICHRPHGVSQVV
jgi:hypothetical protein